MSNFIQTKFEADKIVEYVKFINTFESDIFTKSEYRICEKAFLHAKLLCLNKQFEEALEVKSLDRLSVTFE